MSRDIWNVLGIAATNDERAIKRAYAARLKITSPEVDAVGYMHLREAYEAAKQEAHLQRQLEQEPAEVDGEAEQATATPALAEPADLQVSQDDESRHRELQHPAGHEEAGQSGTRLEIGSPQQQALARLHELLRQRDLDGFREALEVLLAGDTFSTLDDQYLFVGAIAVLLNQFQPLDVAWCGQIAARLNVREHENPYMGDHRFSWVYEQLLDHYRQWRTSQTRTHLQAHDDLAGLPGYLHVYHVLTAPFDAERLSALTRSQTYHRLAQRIFERATSDAGIAIPLENRAWWERTAMAGKHQPVADAAPAKERDGTRTQFWPIWIVFMLLLAAGRSCQGSSREPHGSLQSLDVSTLSRDDPRRPLALDLERLRRQQLCDPQTRELMRQLFRQLSRGDITSRTYNEGMAALIARCPDPRVRR